MVTLTFVNIGILLANIGLLAVFIKLYTEVLKIDHIKRIGKGEDHAKVTRSTVDPRFYHIDPDAG